MDKDKRLRKPLAQRSFGEDLAPGPHPSQEYVGTKAKSRSNEDVVNEAGTGKGANGHVDGEIVIAVMGVTGAGKSTFISTVTESSSVQVGDGLYSETSEINSYRFSHDKQKYVLVDTPGFDDSSKSNEEVVQLVVDWLESSYRTGTRLNGIIYIHNITKSRMQGSAFQNIKMFRALCGPNALQNVVLATSFWDQVDFATGERREEELVKSKDFWAGMVAKGAGVVRISRERVSCLQLVERFASKSQVGLLVQQEIVDKNKKIEDTEVGRVAMSSRACIGLEKKLEQRRKKETKDMKAQLEATRKSQDKMAKKERKNQASQVREQQWKLRTQEWKGQLSILADRTGKKIERAAVKFEAWSVEQRAQQVARQAEERQRYLEAEVQREKTEASLRAMQLSQPQTNIWTASVPPQLPIIRPALQLSQPQANIWMAPVPPQLPIVRPAYNPYLQAPNYLIYPGYNQQQQPYYPNTFRYP